MRFSLIVPLVAVAVLSHARTDDPQGHSKHGSAFDSGMRTKPWVMEQIGDAPFPITSKSPEVQKWFNQGNSLLHSFWFEEAERSFRWCLKLDPDCAMAYWGLTLCGINWFSIEAPTFPEKEFGRYLKFLGEAVKRKSSVSPRERMYIEAWEKAAAPKERKRADVLITALKEIAASYPEDLEAKAQLGFYQIGKISGSANEKVIQEVLAKNPLHPGALHANIHNWDGTQATNALDSCAKYAVSAPSIGHALHMPGHIYSKVGMWHEAAIAMDSATRIELKYMNDRLALPFETWNYPHNRTYLCYIQEQLGMAKAAIQGARDLLAAPSDPEYNPDFYRHIGKGALIRALVKFEMWEEILAPGRLEWDTKEKSDQFGKAIIEALAYNGLGRLPEARASLEEGKKLNKTLKIEDPTLLVAEALIELKERKTEEGLAHLKRACDEEDKARKTFFANDPPDQPWPISRLLGDAYRTIGSTNLAIAAYEKALALEPNDAFALAGLALAHHSKGNLDKAKIYAGRLEAVWSQADPGLKWLDDVRKLHLNPTPKEESPRPERVYQPKDLDKLGPANWRPFAAPDLNVLNVDRKPVTLKDYRGKNVLLVFFLGEACVHCVGQLKSINDRMGDFSAQNTVVLGVCSATPESLKASTTLGDVKITFLADSAHENARRFSSYDDFEEMELHSTILVDKEGRVRWKRTGGDPFTNMNFLITTLKEINRSAQ